MDKVGNIIRKNHWLTLTTYSTEIMWPNATTSFNIRKIYTLTHILHFVANNSQISWTDHVRNEEVLLRVNERRNILNEIRKRKANWIGHILCRNCLLQWVIEGKIKGRIEVIGRRGRRRRKLVDDLKEGRGYPRFKEEALDRTIWRARFGRGFGPVVRQTTKWMNIYDISLRDIFSWP